MPASACFARIRNVVPVLAAAGALQAGAHAATIAVPDSLRTSATQTLALEAQAVGVQVYTCSAKMAGGQPAWVFKAPDAILYDAAGAKLGRHYAGPTWESTDGSKVVGKVRASATPTDDAIAWLLLDAKSTGGQGAFGRITAVQRLATEGGKAPADGCVGASVGKEVQVPYKAVYRFYTN
jgi:hypothetical protein